MKPLRHFPFTATVVIAVMAIVFHPSNGLANSELRDWNLSSGKTIRAEIESVDETQKIVHLRSEDKTEMAIKTSDLCVLDQAWLLEWTETAEELEHQVDVLGGKLDHYQAKGATTVTDFYVYQPSGAEAEGKARPMMILFDPSGKGRRYLLRHIAAGEAAKIILVSCDVFRNNMEANHALRFKEMFAVINQTIVHDPNRVFLGGTSGGACRAFNYSAIMDMAPWAGIYSNGGWLGGMKNWDLPYPRDMRVAMVNGIQDRGVQDWIASDTAVLQKRGIVVSVHAFEGGHQVPPTTVQAKAFKWLLGELN